MGAFYNTNGILTNKSTDKFWIQKLDDHHFIIKEGDVTGDIDKICVKLHDVLMQKIFGNKEEYYSILPLIALVFPYGGLDSEVKISKEVFEKLVTSFKNEKQYNKLLYYYDCRNLLSTLQNSVVESNYLFGQFYLLLNENSFRIASIPIDSDGVQFASGLIVSNIFSVVNYLFINLYSQLDFMTKFVYELENISNDFLNYPRLKSAHILYGDKKKLSLNGLPDSIFDNSKTLNTIITLRNEIVHNSSFDYMPKVYQVFKNGELIEKYILLPDFNEGRLKTFKNRKRFFDDDVRLNEVLPNLVPDFWRRLFNTLSSVNATYTSYDPI
jgi:hypothetical protein